MLVHPEKRLIIISANRSPDLKNKSPEDAEAVSLRTIIKSMRMLRAA